MNTRDYIHFICKAPIRLRNRTMDASILSSILLTPLLEHLDHCWTDGSHLGINVKSEFVQQQHTSLGLTFY